MASFSSLIHSLLVPFVLDTEEREELGGGEGVIRMGAKERVGRWARTYHDRRSDDSV